MTCHRCGVAFDPHPPTKIYCSERCRKRAELKRWRQRMRDHVAEFKLRHGCALCDVKGPSYVLELHHLDPDLKDFEFSDDRGERGREALDVELSKCVVLCAVHHRMVEAGDAVIPGR